MLRQVILGLASLALPWLAPAAAAADLIGPARIIDGDTIEIHGQRIRLFGIDAPEHDQLCEVGGSQYPCGQQATLALESQTGGQTVDCVPHGIDQYSRVVAVCSVGGEDLNAWMVSNGWALAYRYYSTAYVPDEDVAHNAGAGIWRGTFEAPWDWREAQRKAQAQTEAQSPSQTPASGGNVTAVSLCVIKGNISSKGERIYHVPGGLYYNVTVIDTSKGERWFCTEAEAVAAGWRRSKI
jgi:endonuclease YncB( thermonuclease family)